MSILVQCPNPACKTSCSVADANSGGPVRCPKCGKPFVVKPTLEGQKGDTKKSQPSSNANPFPVLPAEFGRYRILKLLGRGGMGAVYLAQDSQLGRQVALKVPFFDASESPQRVERLVREARSAAVLEHPNICTLFDAGQINGRPFITMAYLAGKPLEEEIDPDVPMPQSRAAEIVRKIALALEHAHRKGIVHRDLKPANVMLAASGEPVVMDFGLAKKVVDVDPKETKLTRDGGILGTPSYMAPEQVKGEGSAVGPATDVYALGVILFELLTGKTPYAGSMVVVIGQILTSPIPPVKEFRPDVDSRLDAICRTAMAKVPADRFQSMAEFAEAIGEYLKAPSPSPPPLPVPLAVPVLPPAPVVDRSPFDNLDAASPPKPASKKAKGKTLENLIERKEEVSPPTYALRKAKSGRVVAAAYRRQKWPILAGVAACLLLAALAVLWAGGVLKVKTADGILVVQVNEPNAEVFVDGDRMTVSWNDGGTKAEIHVKPGTRKVEVKKDGFSVDSKELTFKDGGREIFTARLLPDEPRVANADQPPPEKTSPPDTPPEKSPPPVTPEKSPPPVMPPEKSPPPVMPPEKPPPPPDPKKSDVPPVLGAGENLTDVTNSIGMKLKLIKPGTFTMGSPKDEVGRYDNEGPQHEVEITKAFYMGDCPVTKGQFAAFVKDNGYLTEAETAKATSTWRNYLNQTDTYPVVYVSWNDAVKFCEWLSRKEKNTYELPTEAEWEYACRAGTKTAYSFGDAPKILGDYGWGEDHSGVPTYPVGDKKPNPWGLYDMQGNVWQWCADGYDKYQEGSSKDPIGKESINIRVLRGGSFGAPPRRCRSAFRYFNDPAYRSGSFGFRVVSPDAARTP